MAKARVSGGLEVRGTPGPSTDEGPIEYPVVLLANGGTKIVELAPGFDAFVEVCVSAAFGKLVGDSDRSASRVLVPS